MASHPLDAPWWTLRGMLAQSTYLFMTPVLRRGYRQPLEPSDFFPVPRGDDAAALSDVLAASWERQQRKAQHSSRAEQSSTSKSSSTGHSTSGSSSSGSSSPKKQPSLAWALLPVISPLYVVAGIFFALEAVLQVLQAVFLGEIVDFVQNGGDSSRAYAFAGAMAACAFIMGPVHHVCFFKGFQSGFRCRIACVNLIYRKAMRLSRAGLSSVSSGHIMNLISNDVERFVQFMPYLHFAWISPIQAAVVTYLSWKEVGAYTLCGLGVIISLIPMHMLVSRVFAKLRLRTALETDHRVKIMGELLSGMRVVKMYAWELPFKRLIAMIRGREMKHVRQTAFLRSSNLTLFFCATQLIALLTFSPYFLTDHELTPSTVFTTIALFNVVRIGMTLFLPLAMQGFSEVLVSVRRIEQFLLLPEIDEEAQQRMIASASGNYHTAPDVDAPLSSGAQPNGGSAPKQTDIVLSDATCTWDDTTNVLQSLSFRLPHGSLLGVVGPVGSGKSSLLMALLGELDLKTGTLQRPARVSYCSQEPWLLSLTIKENILFGLPEDPERYAAVIKACALEKDIESFPLGHETRVGERGVTLSGGQKARVSLARAVYHEAELYLFDDPLSAVDTKVAEHLFKNCIQSELMVNKTVVLVTHQVQHLVDADYILVLGTSGDMRGFGSFSELSANGLLQEVELEQEAEEEERKRRRSHRISESGAGAAGPSSPSAVSEGEEDEAVPSDENVAENRERGSVNWATYKEFFASGNGALASMFVVLFFILTQLAMLAADFWLSRWVDLDPEDRREHINAFVYMGLVGLFIIFAFVRSSLFLRYFLNSSEATHNNMFNAVVDTSIRFFDVNPTGRIVNRFSNDIGQLDAMLPVTFLDFLQTGVSILGIVLLVSAVNPWVFIITGPLIAVFFFLRNFYLRSARDFKRWEAVERSPMFSHFSVSLLGLPTIRSHNAMDRLTHELNGHLDSHTRAFFMFQMGSRWIGFALDFLSFAFTAATVFAAVIARSSLDPGIIGLSLSYALQLTGSFQWCVRQSAEAENQMTSAERALEYCRLEPEVDSSKLHPLDKPPTQGVVKFHNVHLRYHESLPEVLKGVTFETRPGEKVGIVGRTGAGKSSLLAALFRLSPTTGSMYIDHIDTSKIIRQDLRSQISVIPQDPILFSGSLRYNLDPFQRHSDDAIWLALEHVQLASFVRSLDGELESQIQERGDNISVGQRQLLCLARAILRNNKVLVLDEATANVDFETDALIQQTIRSQFSSCTVLTVAHRLRTIMDSDRVIVMDQGRVVEMDVPYLLLQDPQSLFSQYVNRSAPQEAQALLAIAKAHFENRHKAGAGQPAPITRRMSSL
eukprot:m.86620 g.86620  ORF g.86620 m.86620 type:complete len:1342 (+) comp8438_c0_seq2:3-4028(+)